MAALACAGLLLGLGLALRLGCGRGPDLRLGNRLDGIDISGLLSRHGRASGLLDHARSQRFSLDLGHNFGLDHLGRLHLDLIRLVGLKLDLALRLLLGHKCRLDELAFRIGHDLGLRLGLKLALGGRLFGQLRNIGADAVHRGAATQAGSLDLDDQAGFEELVAHALGVDIGVYRLEELRQGARLDLEHLAAQQRKGHGGRLLGGKGRERDDAARQGVDVGLVIGIESAGHGSAFL